MINEVRAGLTDHSSKELAVRPTWRRRVIVVGKLGITLVSIFVVLQFVSVERFLTYLLKTDLVWFAAAVIVNLGAQAVSALRLMYVATTLGGSLGFIRALRVHFIGLWFNQIFPTGLGGDVVKAGMLRQDLGMGLAIRVVLLDRISGLVFVMCTVAILLGGYQYLIDDVWITAGLAIVSIGFLVTISLLTLFAGRSRVASTSRRWFKQPLVVLADIYQFRHRKPFYQQVWTSLIVHVNGIVVYACLAKALGLDVDIIAYTLLVPLVFLVALLPISFAGWGLREVGAVAIFSWIGMPGEQALALSVLFGMAMIVSAIPGLAAINARVEEPVLGAK